jgi:hypothetical protein
MLLRALMVLLVVLNLGVAAWWASGSSPSATTTTSSPPQAPTLHLVGEVRSAPPSVPQPVTASAPAALPMTTPMPRQCFTIGPFTDTTTLDAARAAIAPLVTELHVREVAGDRRGWRVWLPPLADHDSAVAMAARIDAAGFKDYYVMPAGSEGNSIALGRFGNEQAARRQQAALQAAGFAAQAGPVGGASQWLDVAGTALDPAALHRAIGAVRIERRDCAKPVPRAG